MGRTITWTRCPYCKKTVSFKSEWGFKSEKRFGKTEYFSCKYCKKVFTNGKKEWPQYSDSEKSDLLRKFIGVGIIFSLIIGTIVGYFMMVYLNSMVYSIIGGILVSAFTGFIIYGIYDSEISQSKERFQKDLEAKNELNDECIMDDDVNTAVDNIDERVEITEPKKNRVIPAIKKNEVKLIIENEFKVSSLTFDKIIKVTEDKRKSKMILNLYNKNGDYYYFQDNENYDLETENRIKEYILEKIKELNM